MVMGGSKNCSFIVVWRSQTLYRAERRKGRTKLVLEECGSVYGDIIAAHPPDKLEMCSVSTNGEQASQAIA